MSNRIVYWIFATFCFAFFFTQESTLRAECWVGHDRPLNSTEPRDTAVPEIQGGKTLTVTILDDNGKPIPKARFSYFGEPKPHPAKGHRHYVEADDNGKFVVRFKPNTAQKLFELQVDHPGFAPYNAQWENTGVDPVPEMFTVKLEKAVSGSGTVFDDEGKPLKNCDVEFCIHWQNRSRTPQICSYRVWVKTDENGKWSFDLLPPDMSDKTIHFFAGYKGFMPFEKAIPLSEFLPGKDGKFNQSIRMDRGASVKGRVTDEAGKPIAGATVYSNYMTTREEFDSKTNENGEYQIDNLPDSDEAYLGVYASGKMSTIKEFTISKASPPTVDVMMKPQGKPIRIKIVDKEGKPVPGFIIAIERWGKHRLVNEVLFRGKPGERGKTDKDGVWIWEAAPETEVVFDMFDGKHQDVRDKPATARDEEYVFIAPPALRISGKVLDAVTNEPVPAFKVYLGIGLEGSTEFYWQLQANAGKEGFYSVSENYERSKFGVKIEAEGYETATSRDIQNNEGSVTIDFSLKKLSAEKLSQTLHGTVLTPDGSPAAIATVILATSNPKNYQSVVDGRVSTGEPYTVKTDTEGKFRFAYIDFEAERKNNGQHFLTTTKMDDFALFLFHTSGFKRITQKEWEETYKTKPITLEKWGRIEGIVKFGTKPAASVPLSYSTQFSGNTSSPTGVREIFWSLHTETHSDGKFSFEKVPPVSGFVQRGVPAGENSVLYSGRVNVEVPSGETVSVQIGGVGRPVTGKLVPAKDFETTPDWKFCVVTCSPYIEPLPEEIVTKMQTLLPQSLSMETDVIKRQKLLDEWTATEEGKEYKKLEEQRTAWFKRKYETGQQQQISNANQDGTFRIDNIPEGDWEFTTEIKTPEWQISGSATHRFKMDTVSGGVSDEPLDIGTLTLKKVELPKPLLQPGQPAPDFEIKQILPDGGDAKLKLSDYKGKYVVLDFWATWCVPCIQKLPEHQKFYELMKSDPKFVMIGITLDNADSADKVAGFISERKMPWLHGLPGGANAPMLKDYGVSSIPALLLIDPDGNIVLTNPTIDELKRKLEEKKK